MEARKENNIDTDLVCILASGEVSTTWKSRDGYVYQNEARLTAKEAHDAIRLYAPNCQECSEQWTCMYEVKN